MNKSIKTLVVGMLGVLLTTGAVAKPASASVWDSMKDGTFNQKYQTESTVQSHQNYSHEATGLVATKEDALKYEGWSVVNGNANQILFVRNGAFVSGWLGENRNWKYFDPATNYLVRNQARVIDGKEYYFREDGRMLHDCNKDGYYYGSDGAKTGSYNSNCSGNFVNTISVGRTVDGKRVLEDITVQDYENRVSQGVIKAKINSAGTVGSGTVGHYLALYSD
ncbi:hypothetical protein [Clostridium butyricum]|uniref:hypothetical protein n=1 Tax=Clostridium butyricum TaxID=1492 RepID=UPI0018AB2505|nr:hypothetical protein [Clostridium butyricum]MDB2155673.1 hypothetical protein [Clostridium butyricum]